MGLILALSGCDKTVDYKVIQKRSDIAYLPNTTTPFSGRFGSHYTNGQNEIDGTYKNGLAEGMWRRWHENGQLSSEQTFRNGQEDGLYRTWHENGQLLVETTLKNGKEVGTYRSWNERGQLQYEVSYKSGAREVIFSNY